MTDPTQAEVPAGMKPWHGGDSAPDDWDGGPVLYRAWDGWRGDIAQWKHAGLPTDIIAYTPTPSTSVQGAGEAGERLETLRVLLSMEQRPALRAWADELATIIAALSTPPAPASIADEDSAREVLAETAGFPKRYAAHCRDTDTVRLGTAIAAMLAFAARPAGEGEDIADLKEWVIAFGGPWAVTFARDQGLPAGHLHPTHYDILAKCGTRMDDFSRAALATEGTPS